MKPSARSLVLLALVAGCSSSTNSGSGSGNAAVCGNAIVEYPEACDQGSANGSPGKCKADCSGIADGGTGVSVEGDVFAFLTEVRGPRLTGVKISLLEHPEISTIAGDDAHFRFDNLTPGEDVTFVVEQSTIQTTQSATMKLGAKGIQPLSVQVVPTSLFASLSLLVPQPPELDTTCAIATTVAHFGGSLYADQRQGMPGVTVTLDPPIDPSSGPIYFNTSALPDTHQTATTIDGGVLFYRVPPGSYVMHAAKSGTVFNAVRINCRAGIIVNAGPPMGLLANVADPDFAAGIGRTGDAYSASTDTLCDQTASCVNAAGTPTSYPPSTQSSCKAMFRNQWAYVDATCDATAKVRDAAKAFFDCRSSSCATTLGNDSVCVAEDATLRAAEAAYGTCLSAAK